MVKVLAVIPARAGSRRLPDKNIRPCAGKPLLVWSIEAAQAARMVNRVIVSSDSAEYRAIAQAAGAEAVDQPGASDTSQIEDALIYALQSCAQAPDFVVCLQPTNPVREPGLIDRCVDWLVRAPRLNSVFTAAKEGIVWQAIGPPPHEYVNQFYLTGRIPQSQWWDETRFRYVEDGSVFVTRTNALLATKDRRALPSCPIVNARSVDIDTEEDLRLADLMLRARVREEVAS